MHFEADLLCPELDGLPLVVNIDSGSRNLPNHLQLPFHCSSFRANFGWPQPKRRGLPPLLAQYVANPRAPAILRFCKASLNNVKMT
jgi:hypothetical protein